MTDPGRPTPACPARNRPRTRAALLTHAVRYAGRLLCWNLAVGMASAAVDVVLEPHAHWWTYTWPVPWGITCTSALAWALLRAYQKNANDPPTDDEESRQDDWEQAA